MLQAKLEAINEQVRELIKQKAVLIEADLVTKGIEVEDELPIEDILLEVLELDDEMTIRDNYNLWTIVDDDFAEWTAKETK